MPEKELKYKSTKDIKVSKKILDQVIGQDGAVEVAKKAAVQRRHVLLIGEPGTGKSMIGAALAELLPSEKLVDVISFPNPNDENQPLIRTVKAGQGRGIVMRSRLDSANMFKNQNIILFIIVILSMFAPWWVRSYYKSDIMFAAFFLGGMFFLAAFVMFINLGQRMGNKKVQIPKVIVDNYKKKQAQFMDATGAHAGALLGDVLHDPFQCFVHSDIYIKQDMSAPFAKEDLPSTVDKLFDKHHQNIMKKENYEAIFLNKNELFVLGETHGSASSVEVLSSNRQDYNGKMIKLTTSENKELIVTPEHKIAIWKDGKIAYVGAKDIREGDESVVKSEDVIIDETAIINTYDERQQEQCRLYYQYLDTKSKNPSWGYKRIAKAMGQKIGKTRWWHCGKHIPVPIQTANWLKEKGLLPLKINNPNLPLIAKALGATFGDGGIFENLNGIFLSSSEKGAVEEFGKDLETIFQFNENSRIIEGGVKGHSWCYQNTNRNLIRFFLALGAPKGNKTRLDLDIPNWIYLSDSFAKEFFGSFFGGELGAPKVHKERNRLQTLDLAITGIEKFEQNRLDFLNRIKRYLEGNHIICTSLLKRKTNTSGVFLYRLMISIQFDNVMAFMDNVKLNYCKYKKDKILKAMKEFKEIKKQKYQNLIAQGYGAESIMKVLKLTTKSLYCILNEEDIKQWS